MKMNIWRHIPSSMLIYRAVSKELTHRTLHSVVNKDVNITSNLVKTQPNFRFYDTIRCKSKKNKYDSDDEEDNIIDDDNSLSRDSKVVKFSTTSMRTDTILKSVLTVSRNKIEQAFYESKIRVNGKKIMKKSASVRLGDEIDVIKMVSPKNPDHLYVSRVEILNITPAEESITVSARRFKNLLIENYEDDPYKGGSTQSES